MTDERKDYWEARLRANAGLRGVGHISHSYSWNGWAYRVKARVLRRIVRKANLDLASANVLDIGSGTGFAIDFWRSQGAGAITGTDLSDFAVQELGARFPDVSIVQGDIGCPDLTVPGAPFDMISALEVLFHIVDDERYRQSFRNVHNLLRPGGSFVFSDNFLRHGDARGAHQASRHRDEIMEAILESGLEPVATAPMFIMMGFPVDSQSQLRQRLWRRTVGRAAKSERWGSIAGGALAAVDVVGSRYKREGPTVELMLCRRPNS